jgi:hypothetical protein
MVVARAPVVALPPVAALPPIAGTVAAGLATVLPRTAIATLSSVAA